MAEVVTGTTGTIDHELIEKHITLVVRGQGPEATPGQGRGHTTEEDQGHITESTVDHQGTAGDPINGHVHVQEVTVLGPEVTRPGAHEAAEVDLAVTRAVVLEVAAEVDKYLLANLLEPFRFIVTFCPLFLNLGSSKPPLKNKYLGRESFLNHYREWL